ncbi:MAG: DoxX protein [Cyanobacteria bacterium P01_G01_bin.39]
MKHQQQLKIGLALIRLSTGIFFLIWSVEKIIKPETTQKIFAKFYMMEISPTIAIGIGVLQTLLVLAFMAGLFKIWTYGAILGMHAVSTISTFRELLSPYEAINHLFWAAVPLLAALIALFLLREEDLLLTIGGSNM